MLRKLPVILLTSVINIFLILAILLFVVRVPSEAIITPAYIAFLLALSVLTQVICEYVKRHNRKSRLNDTTA